MSRHSTASLLAIVGGGFLGAALVTAVGLEFATGAFPLFVLGTAYATVGVVATSFRHRGEVWFPLAVLPGLVTALVALVAAGGLGLLKTSDPLVHLLATGPPTAVAFTFALGVATRRRTQWTAVALLLLAAAPLFATLVRSIRHIEAEDGGAVLIFAVAAMAALVPFALPPYSLGRSIRRALGGASPSSRPVLAVAAVPLVLLLASLLVLPYLLTNPAVLVVALASVAALAYLCVRFVREPA